MSSAGNQGPTEPSPQNRGTANPRSTSSFGGLGAEDLIALNDEIAGMAQAGLPLDQGLEALAREMGSGRLQQATAEIAKDLRAGHTLPEALKRQGTRVPPFYSGLVAAGIRSGRIGEVLSTLTIYSRTLADLRSTVVSSLIYPVVVLFLAATLLTLVGLFVVPQYERIYRDFGLRLPVITEMAFAVLGEPLLYVVYPLATLTVVFLVMRAVFRGTALGTIMWTRFVYGIPIVGTLMHAARLAAFTDLLGILVDHSMPLPEAFRLSGEGSSDPIMAAASSKIQEDLSHGLPLAEALLRRRLVPDLISWMIGLGERRGTLGPTLHQLAEMYRRQVEMRAALLRSVLPPIFIIGTAGLLVGGFAIAVMLPMIKLMEGLSN